MSWNKRNSRFEGIAGWRDYEVRRLWRRALLFVLDRAGCLLLRFRKPFPMGTPPRRILVVRPEHFGDLVLTLPALRRLLAAFPGARIALLVRPEYAGWMSSWGVADEVLPLDVPWTRRPKPPGRGWVPFLLRLPAGGRYDLAMTFHGDLRTICLACRFAPQVAGYGEGGGGFLLAVSHQRDRHRPAGQAHCDLVAEVAARFGGVRSSEALEQRRRPATGAMPAGLSGPYLILHPGAGQPSKFWFPDRWLQVASVAQQWGWTIVLTGSEAEHSLCARIAAGLELGARQPVLNLAGQTSLADLSTLVAQAQAVVAPDTGIIHLAVALGTPSVALFGPNDPRQWGYQSPMHHSLVRPQPCSFCRLAHCPRTDAPRICLHAISVTEVIADLQQVLSSQKSREATVERIRHSA